MNHGRHIKVMGLGDSTKLGSVERVQEFLVDLVAALGMRPLAPPTIHSVEIDIKKLGAEPFEDEGGVTGTVVLSTSHAAIHTWPERRFFTFDVFSCRDFDPEVVETMLYKSFATHGLKMQNLECSYPVSS